MRGYSAGAWFIEHDFDGDGLTDLNDRDSDDDGLTDLQEDRDRDGVLNEGGSGTGESNPYDADTDDDGLLDGAEVSPWEDTDEDGTINIRDVNSNDDSYNDNLQVWVVFRTNAVEGDYSGTGVWVGPIAPSANPYYPEVYNYAASVALYKWHSTVSSVTGAGQIYNPYGPNGDGPFRRDETPVRLPLPSASDDHLSAFRHAFKRATALGIEVMAQGVARVKVHLPHALEREFGIRGAIVAEGPNLEAALTALDAKSPGLSASVLDDQGKVRKNVIVILNRDTVTHLDPSTVKLKDGDEIHVLPHVAGG